jgi:outer membrane receptor protein involved in Fe transport
MSKLRSVLFPSIVLTLGTAVLPAAMVMAQSPPAGGSGGPASTDKLEEVVVTATKRAEDLQSVPLSITALSAVQLESKGVQQFFDYGTAIPNLSFGNDASDGTLSARGIALRGIEGSNTTGFYIDDTPVLETLDPHIVDIARIEVLRGPQGTLYGAESMGGTVRLITEQPSFKALDGQAHVIGSGTDHGSFNQLVEGVVNVPLVPDTVALRASAFYEFDDGYFDKGLGPENAPPTSTISHVGSMKYYGGQVALRFEPASGLSVTPRIMYQKTTQDGSPYAYDTATNLTQREVFNLNPGGTDRWYLASLTLNYNVPYGSFVSSSAYFDRKTFELEDDTDVTQFFLGTPTVTPPPIASPITREQDLLRFAQEVRFASSFQGPFQLLVGGFYSNSTRPRDYEWTAPGAAPVYTPTDLLLTFIDSRNAKEYALFGDASYDVLSNLKATVGIRWFRDTATFNQFTNGFFFGNAPSTYLAPSTSESGFTPKYLVEYKALPDVLLYASAAKGFREGGNNIALPPGPPPAGCDADLANLGVTAADVATFKSDNLWNYEVGFKSSFADRRFTLNGAGFSIDWDKIQQAVHLPLCGYGYTGNAGRARSTGVELEFSGRLLPELTLGLGFGYEDAHITEQGGGTPQPAGSPVYQVPKDTVAANLEYARPLTAGWAGFARADYAHVGSSYSANNDVIAPRYRAGYSLTDLRLGGQSERYEAVLFVKNLTNQHANLGDAVLIGSEEPGHPRFVISMPRTIGVEARMRFK